MIATSVKAPLGAATARHRIACVLFAAAGLCLMLTGCTVSTIGRPAAAPDLGHWQPPPILSSRLGNLLLSESDVNVVGGTTAMALRRPISEMSHSDGLGTNRNCLDAYSPIEAAVYQDSNWVAVQGQLLDNVHSRVDAHMHALVQAVVGFRDADAAQQFFSRAEPRWSACANRTLTITQPDQDPVSWALGELVTSDTALTIMQTLDGVDGFACQRAMGVRNNIIIDALWCGFDTTNQAGEVVTKIAAAVSQA
ncbi:sensor domain-containing protein [Mycobacterium malmoense]|uniref:PknH-like extracellular domain-containing protein n=1 Tax=Mycobacterium malmoense TaxID=1780 RepID=A0ABX3ST10_MYCMA|nr:sensor domain-containing protein [Mycobacterium malmoense]ORA83289.1 hypothetical protein BST29_10535 [Mycobacterium malmoense]QZA16079.1 sensor domain-containing protein [Mycobacterium malmoense]UNB92891.1 sensor domain-containing protein [Mycobacterium malmoense]